MQLNPQHLPPLLPWHLPLVPFVNDTTLYSFSQAKNPWLSLFFCLLDLVQSRELISNVFKLLPESKLLAAPTSISRGQATNFLPRLISPFLSSAHMESVFHTGVSVVALRDKPCCFLLKNTALRTEPQRFNSHGDLLIKLYCGELSYQTARIFQSYVISASNGVNQSQHSGGRLPRVIPVQVKVREGAAQSTGQDPAHRRLWNPLLLSGSLDCSILVALPTCKVILETPPFFSMKVALPTPSSAPPLSFYAVFITN